MKLLVNIGKKMTVLRTADRSYALCEYFLFTMLVIILMCTIRNSIMFKLKLSISNISI